MYARLEFEPSNSEIDRLVKDYQNAKIALELALTRETIVLRTQEQEEAASGNNDNIFAASARC